MMNREMQRALEADGEKLRQLTGEDHEPFEACDYCGSVVAIESMHAVGCITHHEFICVECLPKTVVLP